MSSTWLWDKLFVSTRGLGLSHHSRQSLSTGVLVFLDKVRDSEVVDAPALCKLKDHLGSGPTDVKVLKEEEHMGMLRESKLWHGEQPIDNLGSWRLSFETSGLPTVTDCLSNISSSMWGYV